MTDRKPLPEAGPTLASANRRILAERLHWPAGARQQGERLESAYPRWSISWSAGNDVPGFERPSGFYGVELGYRGWRRVPVYGATAAALADAITARTGSASMVRRCGPGT